MKKIIPVFLIVMFASHATPPDARDLLLREFRTTYPEDAVHLEIIKVFEASATRKEISYRVVINDQRDPDHPALNRMAATATFESQDGRWQLRGVRELKQSLEFLSP